MTMASRLARLLRAGPALAALALVTAGAAFAQDVDDSLWVANGTVRAVARDGGTIYLGGTFTQVGPPTGGALPLESATGLPLGVPRVAGIVYAIAADGAGGWYVGGAFTHVGGTPRSNIAHIGADHAVSPWNPGANDIVYALALREGALLAGGAFTSIGGQPRNRLAALDRSTGLATSWNPDPDGFVLALAVAGGTIYAGGTFANIGGQPRARIAALDTLGGATSWAITGANGTVRALAVSGGKVYVGGDFTVITDSTRNRIAALRPGDGLATEWNPDADGLLFTLVLRGGVAIVGGGFGSIGGQARTYIAAVDTLTGLATSWAGNANGFVRALAVRGDTVYAGGDFTVIADSTRNRIAALRPGDGVPTDWNPNANGTVHALSLGAGAVYAGGSFTSFGGVARNNVAALDVSTGAATGWKPDADNEVWALALMGNTVYAAGDFTQIGGQPRNRIAALDAVTGEAASWNPNANGMIYTLATSGAVVYAAGWFTSIGGQPRNRIAALDATTGLATSWNPNANFDVWSLAVGEGVVYAGGQFGSIGGQPRLRIAALDAATGLATGWNPGSNGAVYALALHESALLVGGAFTSIGGQPRNHLAALDTTSGAATGWNPDANFDVNALAPIGNSVYVGGEFGSIGGHVVERIARVDATTGQVAPWSVASANRIVLALAIDDDDGVVYAGGEFTTLDGTPQSGIAAAALAPEITAIVPDRGGNGGPVTVGIAGHGLANASIARLAGPGRADTIPGQVTTAPDGVSLSVTFDLEGAEDGPWDLSVATPAGPGAVVLDGFVVEAAAPYEIRVNILGAELMRANRRKAFDVVLENLGNGDALHVPLWISGIPDSVTVEADFVVAAPPQDGGEPDWSAAPLTLDGPGGRYLAMVIPRLPPGVSVRRLYLTVPSAVTTFELVATLAPPWTDGEVLRGCLAGGGVIGAPACMGAQLAAIHAYLAATPGIQALGAIGLWAKIAWQCEGAATLPAALAKAEQALDFMLQPIEGTAVPADCEVALVPRWQDRRRVTIVTSIDPNDKLGIGGVGASRLVGGDQLLPYSIRFENLETAPAPAQEVVVVDALDMATLDVTTVSLGPITFGSRTISPLPGSSRHRADVDLRPDQDLIVQVVVNLDVATGVLTWSFTSIDPSTGRLTEDPQAGFLPPNVTPPQGEGSVLFTVLPKAGLAGGTAIQNQATLIFDGDALLTPEWSNLLDTTAPESAVLPLPSTQDSVSFTVRWAAPGPPPDLHDYSVYVSENGGAYRPWRVHTTATADTITAPGGWSYAFYSLARDSSGNLEEVPGVPDVETFSRVAVDARAPLALALEGTAPNPALAGQARVWFTLPGRERAVIEVYDVAGRRLLRRDVTARGPGRHSVEVGAAVRSPGLYWLRLTQGGQTRHARMVAMR